MSNAFNEYMAYCDNQEDGAGYSTTRATINTLLEDLDDWGDQKDFHAMRPTKHVEIPFKRHRGDYQYGRG